MSSTALRMSWINTSLANSSGVASWSAPRAEPKLPNEPAVFPLGDVKNGERGVVALSGTGNVGERGERSKRERSGDKRVWNIDADVESSAPGSLDRLYCIVVLFLQRDYNMAYSGVDCVNKPRRKLQSVVMTVVVEDQGNVQG